MAYHPPGRPFHCNLCRLDFGTRHGVERHFNDSCFPKHAHIRLNARWNDHPSCFTQEAALAHHCARPFYPDWQKQHSKTGEITLSWPNLSGWPTSPAELERKNAAHRAIPGANPYFVDTQENVYADVASDQESHVCGEDPLVQLQNFIQVVDARSVALLLEAVKTKTWTRGYADDVFFAIALHLSEERIAKLLECRRTVVRLWFIQAQTTIFTHHVKVTPGLHPADMRWPSVSEQDNVWRDLVQAFMETHVTGQGGQWKRLSCCEEGRIEEAFAEAAEAAEAANVECSQTAESRDTERDIDETGTGDRN